MAKVVIEESILMWLEKNLQEMEAKLRKPPVELFSRQVQGVQANLAAVFPAGFDTYTFIDGMDMTVDCDSRVLLVDEIITMQFSGTPGGSKLALEVDGVVDTTNFSWFNPTVILPSQHGGSHVAKVMPGRHRIRVMLAITTSRTVTLTDTARYMRVTGLTNPRKG